MATAGHRSCAGATRCLPTRRTLLPGLPTQLRRHSSSATTTTSWRSWISCAPGSISKADGLFRVPVAGAERGRVVQFLAVPYQAETCGPVIDDRDGSVFVAVQHPGEEGSWDEQLSYFPDYVPARVRPRPGAWRGPRPERDSGDQEGLTGVGHVVSVG